EIAKKIVSILSGKDKQVKPYSLWCLCKMWPCTLILSMLSFILTNYHCLLLMRGARFKRNHIAVIDSDCGECVG
ncbi:hypothetical protein BMR11_18475, partial [Methylococcaceae bacterium CS5]